MILKADSFSSEEFLGDIVSIEMFCIEKGRETWDEKAWHPSQAFKRKWGFLLDGVSDQDTTSPSP